MRWRAAQPAGRRLTESKVEVFHTCVNGFDSFKLGKKDDENESDYDDDESEGWMSIINLHESSTHVARV